MKIGVMVDLEGISGVVVTEQALTTGQFYPRAREYMTGDVNACVEGLFAGGAERVVVRDAHAKGFNLLWHELDPRAEYVQGSGVGPRMPGIEEMDGLVLLGYHAMAGTEGAVLEHTMSSAGWQNFWINGTLSGEIAIDAAVAGEAGVPVIMVSGCDKACAEARRFIPGVHTAVVKYGYDCCYARLLSMEKARALIRDTAREAVRDCGNIAPYRVPGPVTLRLELVERGRVPDYGAKPYFKRIDGRTYEVTGNTVLEALERL